MEQFKIEKILRDSIRKLFVDDTLFFSKDYNIHERTVAHRLATYIEKSFPRFDVDVEYNRMRDHYGLKDFENIISKRLVLRDINGEEQTKNVYPDIIVHKRNQQENLIVIELKFSWKNNKKDLDFKKINAYMEQLHYRYGVYIELAERYKECKIEFGPFSNDGFLNSSI
jgi:hypothetical protein